MQSDVEHYVTRVCTCLKQKKPCHDTRAPLTNIVTTQPFELVCIDFLHLDRCRGGYEYILVVVDHFTHFAQAYATTSKSGKTAANLIFNDFALKFGFPSRIHHDQGGEFENQLFSQLKKLSGVAGSRTTPHHPMGNGQVERMNRTLLQMLRTLTETQKSNWKESLNKLVYAYNCTRCEATGYSPFYLLYGRSPRLPVDMLFGLQPESGTSDYRDYVEGWKKGMEEAYIIANKTAEKAAARSKRYYDTKVRSSLLQPGERVLIKNLTPRGGPGKLRNYWEDTVHTVVRQVQPDMPVYEVRPERGKGRSRVLHRNLLMPCDHLPFETQPEPAQNNRLKLKKSHQPTPKPDKSDEDSGNEYELHYEPLASFTGPADRSLGELEEGLEHRHSAAEETVDMPSHEPMSQHLRGELQQERSSLVDGVNLPGGDIPVEHSPHAPSSLNPVSEPEVSTHNLPQRERRPPKRMTYDQLGIPSCYNIQPQVPPIYQLPGLVPWLPTSQPYYFQPPLMYGLQHV
uniref:Integrase catalytic domain-containing protein n=1 Tax=Stegastes partitus TaxID=144197 RepID=A0A3B5AJZ5_9TELE